MTQPYIDTHYKQHKRISGQDVAQIREFVCVFITYYVGTLTYLISFLQLLHCQVQPRGDLFFPHQER